MAALRNILAIIGLLALAGGGWLAIQVKNITADFDPGFMKMYQEFAARLIETKDPGSAMVWAVPVNEDLTVDDVKESMKSLATAKNFLFVGESPFYKQVKAVTGKDYRHVSFLSYCDVGVGKMMLEYNNAYSAFMPCRIALVEDKKGRLWLYSMNLDMMIHGGKELPPELRKEALRIRDTIMEIMEGAAAGEF
jgi:uncharacterized protein (DUF302 family)